MKSNLIQTIAHFGAAFHITITGAPALVAAQVNRLRNFGVASSISEDYKEGLDHTARVDSHTGCFERGLLAMARVNVRGALVKHGLRKPSTVRRLVVEEFEKLRDSFRRIENVYAAPATNAIQYSVCGDHGTPERKGE